MTRLSSNGAAVDWARELTKPAVHARSSQLPKLRAASLQDYAQVGSLLTRNGMTPTSKERWLELWEGNPVLRHWGAQYPIGWVLEIERGEVVGYVGNIPLAYRFRRRELRAATGISLTVDEAHRGYALLLLDCLVQQDNLDLLINTTVSPVAEPLVIFLRFSRVPVGKWDNAAFWITNYHGFSQSVLVSSSVPLAAILSYPIAAGLFCIDKLMSRTSPIHSTCSIEFPVQFDGRFDEFWKELEYQNEDRLLAVRTQETLRWHFQHALERQRAWIVTASQRRNLVAYAIFDRCDNPDRQLKRVRLVDFQALRGFEEMLFSFAYSMCNYCRQADIHVLEVFGSWLDRLALPKALPRYSRNLSSWRSYYLAKNPELREPLRDGNAWVLSSFDGDSSL
jgi:hypothetical protein